MESLENIRKKKGVTKAAMCRHLDISKPTYDAYEKHPERMSVTTAKAIAEFLGVSYQDIFFASNSN